MFDISYSRYVKWRDRLQDNVEIFKELVLLEDNRAEILKCFSSFLSFGTAGARGLIGVGTSRINTITVSHLSQSYSEFVKCQFVNPSLVVSYDTRKFSKDFAIASSEVFASNGIKVYIFQEPSPIGVFSFAIRRLNCSGGVMITASHNPPEYSGYKVYDEYGSQPVNVDELVKIINSKDLFDFKRKKLANSISDGSVTIIEDNIMNEYISIIRNEVDLENISNIDITYSPLNGCASKTFCNLFGSFKRFHIVEEQKHADCNFSTCKKPDPQNLESFKLSFELAKNNNSDVIILNDPDGDRLGVSIRHLDSYVVLSGVEIASLFLNFIVETRSEDYSNFCVIQSIVSGGLCEKIAKANNIKVIKTPTGFKYISRKINELEHCGNLSSFILGFEESNGFLLFPFIRDKDGVSSSAFLCKMVSYYKKRNLSCIDVLNMLYEKFGYRMQKNISFIETDKEKIKNTINSFKNYFATNNSNVLFINDYQRSECYDLTKNKIDAIKMDKSDILEVVFRDDSKLFVRSSGTEPLIKFYIMHTGITKKQSLDSCKKIEDLILKIYDNIIDV